MPGDLKLYLGQLDSDELTRMAKYKGAKIPKASRKSQLVTILMSHNVSRQDLVNYLTKEGRTGIYAKYDGESYEKKVANYFTKQGFKCELNRHEKGMEFDVVGVKGYYAHGFSLNRKWIVVECKDKPLVTMQEFHKFVGKLQTFKEIKGEEDVTYKGYIVTSGIFDPLVQETAERHKEIEIMRMKRG